MIPEHLNGCCCGYLSGATYERAAGWNVAPVSVLVTSVQCFSGVQCATLASIARVSLETVAESAGCSL